MLLCRLAKAFYLHVSKCLVVGRVAPTTLGIQVSMERELAAFPAREMQGLEQSCSWKMKHLCSVELPGRRTWPECGVWAIAALSISDSWFHALFS